MNPIHGFTPSGSDKYSNAIANDTVPKAKATHLSITRCSGDGKKFEAAEEGAEVYFGVALTDAAIYAIAATAGKFDLASVLTTGQRKRILGQAKSDGAMVIDFIEEVGTVP